LHFHVLGAGLGILGRDEENERGGGFSVVRCVAGWVPDLKDDRPPADLDFQSVERSSSSTSSEIAWRMMDGLPTLTTPRMQQIRGRPLLSLMIMLEWVIRKLERKIETGPVDDLERILEMVTELKLKLKLQRMSVDLKEVGSPTRADHRVSVTRDLDNDCDVTFGHLGLSIAKVIAIVRF
jgi:hypothetical protein